MIWPIILEVVRTCSLEVFWACYFFVVFFILGGGGVKSWSDVTMLLMMNTSVWHWWCFFQLSSKKYWGEFSTESIIVVSFGHNRHVTRDISLEEASLWIWSSNSIHCYLSRRKYWPKWPLWGVFYQRSRPMDVLWGRLISKSEKSGGSFLLWSWNTISMLLFFFFLLLPWCYNFLACTCKFCTIFTFWGAACTVITI